MFNKKHYLILLLLIVGICAMSSVSAADNVTDVVANDAAADDVATALNEEVSDDVENQDVLASENDSKLSQAKSDEVLSGTDTPYGYYSIDLQNEYTISENGGTITYYLNPYMYANPYNHNAYNFYFAVSEGNNLKKISSDFISDSDTSSRNVNFNIASKTLAPGTYTLKAINIPDKHVMDAATLKVSGNAVITVSDYSAYYNDGTKMTATIKDKNSGSPIKYTQFQAVFSNGKKTVTKTYTTNADGVISFIPPVGVGEWNVTFSSNAAHIKANAVTKKASIKKSNVAVNAYFTKGYSGLKVTLKAVVKSHNRNVNDGKVTFKINGKTYDVAVKNGVAKKDIKLSKAKKYKYSATFSGDNYYSKKASSKVVIKKRFATKLILKRKHVYYRSIKAATTPFYVTVKTKSGKLVKSGKVKIIDAVKVNKKGKAKFYLPSNMVYVRTAFYIMHYFKHAVKKTYKVKYIPASKAYKPCTAKVTFKELYKCNLCGSTKTHSHGNSMYIVS